MPYVASLLIAAALSSTQPGRPVPSVVPALGQESSFNDSQSAAQPPRSNENASPASDRSISYGGDLNSMANQVSAGMTIGVPVSRMVTIVARPMLLGGQTSADLDLGGRLEVQLRSPIYMDRVRAYFGAGPQGFYEIRGSERHQKDFSGGWDAGIEFFLTRSFALHWEMGTSGGGVSGGAGPVFTVGVRSYPRLRASH